MTDAPDLPFSRFSIKSNSPPRASSAVVKTFQDYPRTCTDFGLWFCMGSTAPSLGDRALARRIPGAG